MKKFFKYLLGAISLLSILVAGAYMKYNKANPTGQTGEEAELMAQKMFTAINKPAWDSTSWVKWTFADRNSFVWDKKNGKVLVKWKDVKVLLNTSDLSGTATTAGVAMQGEELKEVLASAWSKFCNDSFWLNAPAKVLDAGTQRSIVALEDGKKGLKVQYMEGGVTPGDTYIWELDEIGLPTKYSMWVKIIPIGGTPATWENWVTLPTGAKIATMHNIASRSVVITNLEAGMGEVKLE